MEDFDREIKVIVVGNGGVGKTSMIRRFCKGMFTDEYKKTIGVDFLEKKLYVDALQGEVTFMLWDTAGQEEFDAITRAYYRGAGAAVIAFSTTDRASFDAVPSWKSKVEQECGDIAVCLVQNKVDLIDSAVVTNSEVENMARQLGVRLYRTCVKENVNVSEVFMYLVELHDRKQAGPPPPQTAPVPPPATVSQPQSMSSSAPVHESQPAAASPAQVEHAPSPMVVDVRPGPSKVRTKGKKSVVSKLSACSIA